MLTMSVSSVCTLYFAYLFWRYFRKGRSLTVSDSDEEARGEFGGASPRGARRRADSSATFDTNIIWTVVRPVLTQVIASALQDRVTQNSFRTLCVSVLADEGMKAKFREVVIDQWRSKEVQEAAARSVGDCVVSLASSETA